MFELDFFPGAVYTGDGLQSLAKCSSNCPVTERLLRMVLMTVLEVSSGVYPGSLWGSEADGPAVTWL